MLTPREAHFWQAVYVATAGRPGNGSAACATEADRAVEELRKRQVEIDDEEKRCAVTVFPGGVPPKRCKLRDGHDGSHDLV